MRMVCRGAWGKVIGAIAIAVLVTACVEGAVSERSGYGGSAKDQITGRYWKLVELNGAPVGGSNREPHIVFNAAEKRLSGSGGCNTLMGSYELLDGTRLRFSKIASTMMACSQGMDIEQGLFKALETTDSYNLNDNTLVLNSERMAPLARFEAVQLK